MLRLRREAVDDMVRGDVVELEGEGRVVAERIIERVSNYLRLRYLY